MQQFQSTLKSPEIESSINKLIKLTKDKEKKKILTLVKNVILEEALPECKVFFKDKLPNSNNNEEVKFNLSPLPTDSLKGVGDANVLLGTLYNSELKVPVAVKIAYSPNLTAPSWSQDNSGYVEFLVYQQIREIILLRETPCLILPFFFQQCNLDQSLDIDTKPEIRDLLEREKADRSKNTSFDKSRLLITVMERGETTLRQWVRKTMKTPNMTWEQFKPTILEICFMMGHLFHVLIYHGIVNHDTHQKNIFAFENKEQIAFKNDWDDVSSPYFVMKPSIVPKSYDFDQAYYSKIENTGLTNTALCQSHGICNEMNEKWDLFRFLKTLYNEIKYQSEISKIQNNNEADKGKWARKFMDLASEMKWFDRDFFKKHSIFLTEGPEGSKEAIQHVKDSDFASIPQFLNSFESIYGTTKKPNQNVNVYAISK